MDFNLVNSLKNGDEKAFEAIFKQYFTGLCHYATSIVKSDAIAEEIVEDLFLKIWEDTKTINFNISIRAYLYKSVHNRCLKFIRHLAVEQKYIELKQSCYNEELLYQSISTDYPIANLISQEIETEIEKAIWDLPDQCRECFCLHRFEDLTYTEIAEKLGISVNTVKTQMTRALHKLKEALKDFLPVFFLLFGNF